jgi:hypothetical protein
MTDVKLRTLLNALNLYLALHFTETPMTKLSEFWTALNPAHLRFYFLTLWAWFSLASTIVCILLPMLHFGEMTALLLAVLLQFVWVGYALSVLSWRVSGFLYQQARQALDRMAQTAQEIVRNQDCESRAKTGAR